MLQAKCDSDVTDLFAALDGLLHSPNTQFHLSLRPSISQAKCDGDVTDLFAALDGLLHDVDAQGVCSVFDFCPQAEGR